MSKTYVAVTRRDLDAELKHGFKYIKREKKNGKWRYYYDVDQLKDDLGFDERDAANKQHDFTMTVGAMRDHVKQQRDNIKVFVPSDKPGVMYESSPQGVREKENKNEEVRQWDAKYNKEVEKYYEKLREYYKTPIGKVAKFVDKGKDIVEDILGRDIWRDFKKSKQ